MSAEKRPRRGQVTFDSPSALRARTETEMGRAVILRLMPDAVFTSTLREVLEEGAKTTSRRKQPPQGERQ